MTYFSGTPARLRGTPIANYTPPPGNTVVGFLEKLKKLPWPVWAVAGVAVLALILGPRGGK